MELDIKIFRLKSGEEIMARYTDNGDSYFFEKPMIIIPQDGGNVGFSYFMPYSMVPDQGLHMPKEYIAFEANVVMEMREQYETLFDDAPKIYMPEQGIITG